jgi:hypothetical protein
LDLNFDGKLMNTVDLTWEAVGEGTNTKAGYSCEAPWVELGRTINLRIIAL